MVDETKDALVSSAAVFGRIAGLSDADMAEHLVAYQEVINQQIAAWDGSPIPNGTAEHAAVLVRSMFDHAQNVVRILTGELNARVYGTPEMINAATQFLADQDHRFEVIFEGGCSPDGAKRHPLLAIVGSYPNVTLWNLKPELRAGVKAHFAIMDDASFRYEGDKTKPSAVAAFGDKTGMAGKLNTFFDTLRDFGSDRITIPA